MSRIGILIHHKEDFILLMIMLLRSGKGFMLCVGYLYKILANGLGAILSPSYNFLFH